MQVILDVPTHIVRDVEKVKVRLGFRSTTKALESLLQAGAFDLLDPLVSALERSEGVTREGKTSV